MRVKDLMRRDVKSVREESDVSELIEMLVHEHVHGAPVVDPDGRLVGVVTQQDVFFSTATQGAGSAGKPAARTRGKGTLVVRDIMTSPAISATEDTDVLELCRLMYRLRIHRIPVVANGKLTGIVSSLDICGALAEGRLATSTGKRA
jgi:CBS domain-containing protein